MKAVNSAYYARLQTEVSFIDLLKILGKMPKKNHGEIAKMRCVFHQDTSPSLYFYLRRGAYHCYGCNCGGDVFSFVRQMKNLTMTQTVRFFRKHFDITP